jgi:adenylosuccinate synthase
MQKLIAIIGLQFGDEGKGKIVDGLVNEAINLNDGKKTVVVRFQGGTNAGHTIYAKDKDNNNVEFITHAAPSGLTSNADIAIGPQVAFDPEKFIFELDEAKKLFNYSGNIFISERVGILMDYHKKIDAWKENNERSIGTTKSGIGPFYKDNADRLTRITFNDYISDDFENKLSKVLNLKLYELIKFGVIKNEDSIEDYKNDLLKFHELIRKRLKQYKVRLEYVLNDYLNKGDHIIIEGAQGSFLDVDMGTIPDTTSSHLLAPHAFPSLGLPRKKFKIYGIEKIYPTRVGNGLLPTYDNSEIFGDKIVNNAGEFGATTGRRRRVGYPDWVLIKRSVMLNDCDGIFLTRVDNLQDIDVKVCKLYNLNGNNLSEVPLDLTEIKEVIYSDKIYNWKLWDKYYNLSKPMEVDKILKEKREYYVKNGFDSFPDKFKEFVLEHDEFVGCPIIGISIGPGSQELVIREIKNE